MALLTKKPTLNITFRDHQSDRGLFLKRVGTLLAEGYSIRESLAFLLKIEKGQVQSWIVIIQDGLLTGSPFHKELEKVGFSDKTCAQIYLASQYGNYNRTITQCGEHLLKQVEKKKKMRTLLSYPVFLLLFLFCMLLLMRFLILPHMEALSVSVGFEQNIYSNGIVRLVYYSPQISLLMLLVVFISAYILKKYLDKKNIIEKIQFFMKLPVIKSFLKDYYSHFFFYEWGNLFLNGCSFQQIITIMQGEDASKLLKETGSKLSKQMKLGKSIHEALCSLPYFYEEGIQAVSHGESLGKVGTEMLVYASYCENQLHEKIEKLMSRMQPIIFSIVALMIIAIYAALMFPVFTLMEGY